MTVETFTPEPSGSSMLPYPQTKLRISATYHAGTIGELLPAGQPEQVEIELNDDAVPTNPAELSVFVTSLVETLFRAGAPGTTADVVVDPDPGLDDGEVRPL